MINRILIRIKVLQIVYAYYQNGNKDLKTAENELLFSLQKSYDLYHYFLLLIVETTNLQKRLLDNRKNKYVPTQEELNPNMRFAENRLAMQIEGNESLAKYVKEQGISWNNDEDFIKSVLDLILTSELYSEYLANENDSYETDKEFWRNTFKKLICGNEEIESYLEDKSIYFIVPGQMHQVIPTAEPQGWTLKFTEEFLIANSIPDKLVNDIYLFNDYGQSILGLS